MNFYIETLGCARNQVDSEVLAGHLVKNGLFQVLTPEEAELIFINTCSFVQDAVEESIDTILALAEYKKTGKCTLLVVAGCLPERFQAGIVQSLPEVDFFAGTAAYFSILSFIEKERSSQKSESLLCPDPKTAPLHTKDMPRIRNTAHSAYLKVAEGCSRHCTYCIIPKLRGIQRSRPLHDLVAEAGALVLEGVRELNLVAQETTDWGRDLHTGENIADLVRALCDSLEPRVWIRLLYGHPLSISDELLFLMAERKNFCSYLDIPIQHASDAVLRRMGREYGKGELLNLFKRIRAKVPDITLRTTLITGFPGESEEDFLELLEFVKEISFDHLGVFVYSDMEDLPSHHLKDHVPPEIAEQRRDAIMEVQAEISWKKNQEKVGKVFSVLIEGEGESGMAEGRAGFLAPEVDGLIYVDGADFRPGDFVRVEISDAFDYDLAGTVVDE
ncbi:30S ribosomal protein S12 methylthiotransferase RimO [Desulfococcaceae bacterium OttesenSCG-928-F15]|nr:30S ribosomal protein S12 methylthiotransferase RimO [Desulfococcaceae bacterium OttesenSCG-928-F15]